MVIGRSNSEAIADSRIDSFNTCWVLGFLSLSLAAWDALRCVALRWCGVTVSFGFPLQATAIEAKIKKICDAFNARQYDLPDMDDHAAVKKLMNDNYQEMHDARVVLLKVGRTSGLAPVPTPRSGRGRGGRRGRLEDRGVPGSLGWFVEFGGQRACLIGLGVTMTATVSRCICRWVALRVFFRLLG